MEDRLARFLNVIPKLEERQRWVIGIDGLSRSGKSTLTKEVANQLQNQKVPVYVFHIDDYIVERKRRYQTTFEQWVEYYYLQWDVMWLKEHLFKKLKTAKELNLKTYDSFTDSLREANICLPETCLVLVEGVFLQRKEWRPFFDYMFYVDCSRDERFNREASETQKNLEKFKRRYWVAEDYYLETVDPKKLADFVIEN